jgi:hypothetical protein
MFPSSAPVGQPHLLGDVTHVFNQEPLVNPKPIDFIITVLHNLANHPKALENLFDVRVPGLKILGHSNSTETEGTRSFMIWRQEHLAF